MSYWYVYMLLCKDGSYYTGCTTDVARRIAEHNAGKKKSSKYVRARRPAKLVFKLFAGSSRSIAQKMEHGIKRLSKKEKKELEAYFKLTNALNLDIKLLPLLVK